MAMGKEEASTQRTHPGDQLQNGLQASAWEIHAYLRVVGMPE
jgi:hypothetical protein